MNTLIGYNAAGRVVYRKQVDRHYFSTAEYKRLRLGDYKIKHVVRFSVLSPRRVTLDRFTAHGYNAHAFFQGVLLTNRPAT